MNKAIASPRKTGSLDIFRLFAALLIVAIHTSPLLSFNDTADFILTRIIARVAVPFFFMVTGYFLFSHREKGDMQSIRVFCKKSGIIYAVSILLYLPLNFYAGYFNKPALGQQIVKDIIFNGTFYHLWYLPAVLTGVLIITALVRKVTLHTAFTVSLALYAVGLCGDSYYGVSTQILSVRSFYDFIFNAFDYTRNGLFFAPVFLVMGAVIYRSEKRLSYQRSIAGLGISAALLLAEGLLLHKFSVQRHDSMYIMLLPVMYYLFHFLLQTGGKSSKKMRTVSMLIYIIHPWMIVFVRGLAKVMKLQKLLIGNSLIHYLAVCALSLAAAMLLTFLWRRLMAPAPTKNGRAWVEIDLSALKHNAKVLQELLPRRCKLMAVVKANAYGHGDVAVAKTLNNFGIRAFAVATVEEGIQLRKNGIKGEILVLGYTDPRNIACLARYRLTQTVVDFTYAKTLNSSGRKIRVHLKIDTGMHRLGVDYSNLPEIESIFALGNLVIDGVFSHLCVSDRLTYEDVSYTNLQIDRFFETVNQLRSKGYDVGKMHIQASYGIMNYPGLPCDYARAGIGLYGVLSGNGKIYTEADLKPVLSVRARIATVKQVASGESVCYGRQFFAGTDMKIATVTIGYADGIPRNLSESNAHVLLHSKKAPIIGRICMDQLVIDVTHIDEVQPDDIATIIGSDGSEVIRCEDVAEQCGTISNEILSRLGCRLNYVFI